MPGSKSTRAATASQKMAALRAASTGAQQKGAGVPAGPVWPPSNAQSLAVCGRKCLKWNCGLTLSAGNTPGQLLQLHPHVQHTCCMTPVLQRTPRTVAPGHDAPRRRHHAQCSTIMSSTQATHLQHLSSATRPSCTTPTAQALRPPLAHHAHHSRSWCRIICLRATAQGRGMYSCLGMRRRAASSSSSGRFVAPTCRGTHTHTLTNLHACILTCELDAPDDRRKSCALLFNAGVEPWKVHRRQH